MPLGDENIRQRLQIVTTHMEYVSNSKQSSHALEFLLVFKFLRIVPLKPLLGAFFCLSRRL